MAMDGGQQWMAMNGDSTAMDSMALGRDGRCDGDLTAAMDGLTVMDGKVMDGVALQQWTSRRLLDSKRRRGTT